MHISTVLDLITEMPLLLFTLDLGILIIVKSHSLNLL